MKLQLISQQEKTDLKTVSDKCMNLLIANQLQDEFDLYNTHDQEKTATIYRVSAFNEPQGRANRTLGIAWESRTTSPLEQVYPFKTQFSESVFGKPITLPKNSYEIKIAKDHKNFEFEFPKQLRDFLRREQNSLIKNQAPMVVKVKGAWAYLDRGRAWGLTMKSRLVIAENNEIKGHIVGFYGPGLNLKSSRGFPVQEGAIMYVRAGQHLVQPGQTVKFDDKTYPAELQLPAGH